jgi:hypothetical protein
MAPEDIRWDLEDHGGINQDGWAPSGPLRRQPSNVGMAGASRVRGRLSRNVKDFAPLQNGITRIIDHIDIPNTENVVIEVIISFFKKSDIKRHLHIVFLSVESFSTQVERVLSNPNLHEIEKARKLLKVS